MIVAHKITGKQFTVEGEFTGDKVRMVAADGKVCFGNPKNFAPVEPPKTKRAKVAKDPNAPKMPRGRRPGDQGTCTLCGQKGHYRGTCPNTPVAENPYATAAFRKRLDSAKALLGTTAATTMTIQ